MSVPLLRDAALRSALRAACAPKVELRYPQATHVMKVDIDGRDGVVRDVYAGREVVLAEVGNKSAVTLNVEHTWPKSRGVEGTPAKADLYHLYPVDSEANQARASLPFGEVHVVRWSKGEARAGLDAHGVEVFEPPKAHRGHVARALFYVSTVYDLPLPDGEEATLRRWNREDPPDDAERERMLRITAVQGNVNPFVLDPTLPDRIDDF